jgi:L-iditol 2-dehydrogenase
MQALVLTKYRSLELKSVERPDVGPDDVLVAVRACGICGSDVHGYDGSSGRRIPPVIMGHEASGVVAEVGAHVSRFHVGERVTFDSTVYCGKCDACRRGDVNLCEARRVLGVSCADYRQPGAFAEYVVVPERIVVRLPDGLSFEHAVLAEPVAVALHAVSRLRLSAGDRGVVVGSGMIGLLVIQALRLAGCEYMTAVDLDEDRLRLARDLGATTTINPANIDPVAAILADTDGRGADIALEVVGNASAIATAIGCIRRGGQIVLVGNVAPEVPLPLQTVVTRELTLLGSCASAGEFSRAVELIAAGQILVQPVLSAVARLDEGPHWFERLYAREPGLMKVVLCPQGNRSSDG